MVVGVDSFRVWGEHAAASKIALIVTDVAGIVTVWSQGAADLYGWSADETLGRPIQELTVGPTDQSIAREIMAQVVETGAWEGEFHARSKSGDVVEVHVRDMAIRDVDGTTVGIAGISFDVSLERHRMRERAEGLRALAREVNEARQRERQVLSRNLHDDVGQVLTVLRSEISGWYDSEQSCGTVFAERGPAVIRNIDSALQVVRDISSDLLDRSFDVWVMVLRIFDMTDELGARTGMVTECDIDGTVEHMRAVPSPVALVTFQVLREALINCERHSRASHVGVAVKVGPDFLSVSVSDDGVGMNGAREGVGTRIMKDRISQVGGVLSFTSPARGDSGTEVCFGIPVGKAVTRP